MDKITKRLHNLLMQTSTVYNQCWWNGLEETCARMRQELADKLLEPHG